MGEVEEDLAENAAVPKACISHCQLRVVPLPMEDVPAEEESTGGGIVQPHAHGPGRRAFIEVQAEKRAVGEGSVRQKGLEEMDQANTYHGGEGIVEDPQ
eukprot:2727582-Lingulodinium_polyedra.AAC.1